MKFLNNNDAGVCHVSHLLWIAVISVAFGISCKSHKINHEQSVAQRKADKTSTQAKENALTQAEKKEGWVLLFDGHDTNKWRKVYGDTFPAQDWIVKDGALTVQKSNGQQGGSGGSIVTKNTYSDFELKLDFKLTKGANSGIKYFVVEDPDYFKGEDPAGRGIGLEYQIIDDARPDVHENNSTASLYDMIVPSSNKSLKPIGAWNHARIVSKGHHVEHWLNGEKVLEYQRGSQKFRSLVRKSKYHKYRKFGLAPEGHILLQDHGSTVSYRNIKIRKL